MYTVEWLKDDIRIGGQAMFGDRVTDIVREAKRAALSIFAENGRAPDMVRITDGEGKAVTEPCSTGASPFI